MERFIYEMIAGRCLCMKHDNGILLICGHSVYLLQICMNAVDIVSEILLRLRVMVMRCGSSMTWMFLIDICTLCISQSAT